MGYCRAMTELILHHYDLSPYAEKIRLALGLKGMSWHSVDTPMVLPKADHFELTGGYRRVPVLQVGADVYCDTHLIARVLDRIQPAPALSPPGFETVENALSRWGETSFMMVIMAYFGIGGIFDDAFMDDRKNTMLAPGTDLEAAPKLLPTKLLQLKDNIRRLESLLSDGRPFMLGDTACAADLSTYHPLMMLGLHKKTKNLLTGADLVGAWMHRIGSIGHGDKTPMDSADAIAIANAADAIAFESQPVLPEGMKIGDSVIVIHDDYGSGNVMGQLAASAGDEIAIRRQGERVGEVVVHFPRQDYTVIGLS